MAKAKKQKKERQAEPFWNDFVSLFFRFCKERFDEVPSFDGSQPRDLRLLVRSLRERAEAARIEWNHDNATARFWYFLEFAYNHDAWLREHWLLSNINRMKDTIFFAIKKQSK